MPWADTQACETATITVPIACLTHASFLIQTQQCEAGYPTEHVLTLSFTSRPAAARGSACLQANSCSNTAPDWPAHVPQRWEASRCVSQTPFMSSLGSFSLTTCTKLLILHCQSPPQSQLQAPWVALPTARLGVPASPPASLGCWPTAVGRPAPAPHAAPCPAAAHQLGQPLTATLANMLLRLEVQLRIYRCICTGFLRIPNQPGNAA